MHFIIPDLSTSSKHITWLCHVDESSSRDDVPYDIILGLDFLAELKFSLDFEKRMIRWGENQVDNDVPPGRPRVCPGIHG